jgi:hypothetical protein
MRVGRVERRRLSSMFIKLYYSSPRRFPDHALDRAERGLYQLRDLPALVAYGERGIVFWAEKRARFGEFFLDIRTLYTARVIGWRIDAADDLVEEIRIGGYHQARSRRPKLSSKNGVLSQKCRGRGAGA